MTDALRINFGCGKKKLPDFVNVDFRAWCSPDVYLDVTTEREWPWDAGSAEEIRSFHMIEHLDKFDGFRFIRRCFVLLKPSGTLTLECPDLAAVCRMYAEYPEQATLSIFGHQTRGESMRHKYGYSRDSLSAALAMTGFEIYECGDGTDHHAKAEPCIRVAGRKPG